MRDVRNDVGVLSETIGGLGKLGRTATFAISAPLATLGSFAVQAASDFDASMRNINSIAMMGEKQFDDLSASVMKFGATTRGGAVESANALYTVFSAGITGTSEAMQIMEIATKTAEAGLADMETTTESLVASILGFGQANMTATRASDALTQMVQIGVGSMQQFAGATAKVTPSASALGIEIEELYASLAFLTQRGVNAAVASTQIRSAFTALQKPTEGMESAFRSLSVNGAEDLIEKFGGMEGAFKALINTTNGTSGAIAKLFSNTRAKDFVMQVANNMDIYGKAMDDFEEGVEGATDRAHVEQMKSFSAQWDLMTSAIESTAITIGNVLLPVITPMIHGITDMFNAITNLNPILIETGVQFGAMAVMIPPIIWLMSSLLNPIGLVVAGLGGLTAAFVNEFKSIDGVLSGLFASDSATADLWGKFQASFGDPPPVGEIIPPILVKSNDLVTIVAGDTVWDMWWAAGAEKGTGFTQAEWIAEWVSLNGTINLGVGDIVKIPTTDITSELVSATEFDMDKYIEDIYKSQGGINIMSLMKPSDQESTEWTPEKEMEFAIGRMIEKIPEMFGEVTEAIRAWADENVGMAMLALTRLFEGGGDTEILNNSVADMFDIDFEEHFPLISMALAGLVDSIGTWLLETGVPTLAKGVGRFIGEFGALIGKGFGLLGSFINGGGIEDSTDALGDSVIAPFLEGFGEAADANGFDTGIDSLLTMIAGAIATYAVVNFGIFGAVALAIQKSIGLALTVAKGAGFIGLGVVNMVSTAVTGMTITGAFASLGNTIAFGLGKAIGKSMLALKAFGGLQVALTSSIASAIAGMGMLTLGIVAVSLGIVLAAFTWSQDADAVQDLRDSINDWIGSILAPEGGYELDFARAFEDTSYLMLAGMAEIFGNQELANSFRAMVGNLGVTPIPLEAEVIPEVTIAFNPHLAILPEEWASSFKQTVGEGITELGLEGYEAWVAIEAFKLNLENATVEDTTAFWDAYQLPEEVELQIQNWVANFGRPTVQLSEDIPPPLDEMQMYEEGAGSGTWGQLKTEFEEEVTNDPLVLDLFNTDEVKEVASTAGKDSANAFANSVNVALEEGMSAETFSEVFLTPFSDAWIAVFGTEGTLQTTILSSVATFSAGMATLASTSLTANTQVGLNAVAIGNNITTMAIIIDTQMKKAKGSVASLLEEIKMLASISTNLKIDVKVTGDINAPLPDGSARVGMDTVPFDGFMAELHKGERVLTRSESEMWANGSIPSATTGLGGGSNTTNNNATANTVIIDGSVGVDELLEELERRGIDING